VEAEWKRKITLVSDDGIMRLPSASPKRGPGRPVIHGAYAKATPPAIAARATEITALLMSLPHVVGADQLAAEECGRLGALIESLDVNIAERGAVTGRGGAPRRILDVRARYSKELRTWLEAFGGTPRSRAEWARAMVEGASLADEIASRRRARSES